MYDITTIQVFSSLDILASVSRYCHLASCGHCELTTPSFMASHKWSLSSSYYYSEDRSCCRCIVHEVPNTIKFKSLCMYHIDVIRPFAKPWNAYHPPTLTLVKRLKPEVTSKALSFILCCSPLSLSFKYMKWKNMLSWFVFQLGAIRPILFFRKTNAKIRPEFV